NKEDDSQIAEELESNRLRQYYQNSIWRGLLAFSGLGASAFGVFNIYRNAVYASSPEFAASLVGLNEIQRFFHTLGIRSRIMYSELALIFGLTALATSLEFFYQAAVNYILVPDLAIEGASASLVEGEEDQVQQLLEQQGKIVKFHRDLQRIIE